MERETGVEPATSSLGSWHSTTELLPPVDDLGAHLIRKHFSSEVAVYPVLYRPPNTPIRTRKQTVKWATRQAENPFHIALTISPATGSGLSLKSSDAAAQYPIAAPLANPTSREKTWRITGGWLRNGPVRSPSIGGLDFDCGCRKKATPIRPKAERVTSAFGIVSADYQPESTPHTRWFCCGFNQLRFPDIVPSTYVCPGTLPCFGSRLAACVDGSMCGPGDLIARPYR